MQKYVISISRQFGSLGRPIAKKLAELLEIEYYDRDIVEEASKVHNIPLKEASNLEESAKYLFMSFPLGSGTTATQDALFKTESEMIKKTCREGILHHCRQMRGRNSGGLRSSDQNFYLCAVRRPHCQLCQ